MKSKNIVSILVVLIILTLGWYLVSPVFIDQEVNEELPSEFLSISAQDESLNLPSEEELADKSEEELRAMEGEIMEKMKDMPDIVSEDPMPVKVGSTENPILLAEGDFRDADSVHQGSGRAMLFQLPDGSNLLRLEDFQVTNGPDLYIYLVEKPNPRNSADVKEGFYSINRLKGNKGDQNYAIPDDVNLDEYGSVAIYCKRFSVLFSVAELL